MSTTRGWCDPARFCHLVVTFAFCVPCSIRDSREHSCNVSSEGGPSCVSQGNKPVLGSTTFRLRVRAAPPCVLCCCCFRGYRFAIYLVRRGSRHQTMYVCSPVFRRAPLSLPSIQILGDSQGGRDEPPTGLNQPFALHVVPEAGCQVRSIFDSTTSSSLAGVLRANTNFLYDDHFRGHFGVSASLENTPTEALRPHNLFARGVNLNRGQNDPHASQAPSSTNQRMAT